MKPYLFFITIITVNFLTAQITDPVATEVWNPVPKVVTTSSTNVPSDAIILFDGNNLSAWSSVKDNAKAMWEVSNGAFTVKPGTGDIKTNQKFGSCQLHLEFKMPPATEATGQGRGNSGLFFQERYEVQVLDNYNNRTYSNGQCGAIYKQSIPLVNACKAPGEWQTYDIIFTAPVFNADGIKVSSGYLTVIHNGILIQNHVEIKGTTEYIGLPKNDAHGKGSIILQDHGNLVSYRNVWLREL
jgi:hypothetical protein